MALALVRPSRMPATPGTVALQIDLGSNRYYQYSIGDDSTTRDNGFPVLDTPTFTSPVLGPLPESSFGRLLLEVPSTRFDRDHRTIQLTSFRTKLRDGPAVSEPQHVTVTSPARGDFPLPVWGDDSSLPHLRAPAPSLRQPMNTHSMDASPPAPWRYAEPMGYREVRPMSSAMFLGQLLPMLASVIGKVAPIISAIAKSPAGAPTAGAPATGGTATASPSLLTPETIKLLTDLLQQLAAPAASTTKSLSVPQRYVEATEYSHAAIAPALLAALPALMPLLEKVLTPETVKAILDTANPTKIIGAVTDSVKEIGKLGLDFDKQSNEHLRALNPMGVHGAVDELLQGMGFASSATPGATKERSEPAYRRVESVELNFVGASPVMIHGRSRVCYRKGEDIAFAFDVKTPRTISDASVAVLVKDPSTRNILVRKRIAVTQIVNGRLPARIAFSGDDLKSVASGEEYLVCAYLTWKNARNKIIGTSRTQMITLIGEYIFDRVEHGSVVPLNDVAKFRPFWHKAWQGSFDTALFKVDFEGKYIYALEPKRTANAPIETTLSSEGSEGHVRKARLRTGMTTSLSALNALIPLISNGQSLNEAQLSALSASDFVARFNTGARFNAVLSGRPGVTAALWIYPEVNLHEVVLFKAASIDADAHVRELVEERVKFPIPVTVHVIGTRSTQ